MARLDGGLSVIHWFEVGSDTLTTWGISRSNSKGGQEPTNYPNHQLTSEWCNYPLAFFIAMFPLNQQTVRVEVGSLPRHCWWIWPCALRDEEGWLFQNVILVIGITSDIMKYTLDGRNHEWMWIISYGLTKVSWGFNWWLRPSSLEHAVSYGLMIAWAIENWAWIPVVFGL